MKKIKISIIALIAVVCIVTNISCDKIENLYEKNQKKITIEQGVAGTLTLRSGDEMPGRRLNLKSKEKPIKRKIRIYELANITQANYSFYTIIDSIHTNLITTVESDKNGFYQIFLPEGKYSMVIEEAEYLYAKIDYESEEIMPVSISSQDVTIKNVVINDVVYYN